MHDRIPAEQEVKSSRCSGRRLGTEKVSPRLQMGRCSRYLQLSHLLAASSGVDVAELIAVALAVALGLAVVVALAVALGLAVAVQLAVALAVTLGLTVAVALAVARRSSRDISEMSRTLPLAFLAPEIVSAILKGRHPTTLPLTNSSAQPSKADGSISVVRSDLAAKPDGSARREERHDQPHLPSGSRPHLFKNSIKITKPANACIKPIL